MIQGIGLVSTVLTTVGKKSGWAALTRNKIRQYFELQNIIRLIMESLKANCTRPIPKVLM